MSKACDICRTSTVSSTALIRHYKEKHSSYYKLYLRLWIVKGAVTAIASFVLVVIVLNDVNSGMLSLSTELLAPVILVIMMTVWLTVSLYQRKVRKSLSTEGDSLGE